MDTHARVVEAFMIMQISGGAGLFIILATAVFSRNVHRYTTWYSFCASWAFSCISYSLLAFSGQQTRTMPDFNLCVVQAALIYAAPVLYGYLSLSLSWYWVDGDNWLVSRTGSTTLSFMMHVSSLTFGSDGPFRNYDRWHSAWSLCSQAVPWRLNPLWFSLYVGGTLINLPGAHFYCSCWSDRISPG